MISTKIISGCVSAILANASKPSTAVITSQPTFFSKVSAVRRIVFESSITMTFKPSDFCSIFALPSSVSRYFFAVLMLCCLIIQHAATQSSCLFSILFCCNPLTRHLQGYLLTSLIALDQFNTIIQPIQSALLTAYYFIGDLIMHVRLGIVMDPIDRISFKKDSSLAMLLSAQSRGWSLFYMEQQDLYQLAGQARARMRSLQVFDNPQHWFR